MEFVEPDGPAPEPVIDYDFVFLNGRGVQITVWPERGDEAAYNIDDKQWEFTFPRLDTDELVLRENVLTMVRARGKRVYIDPQTLMKQMKERQDRERRDKEERRGRRG